MTRTIPNNYSGQYDLDTSSEIWNLDEGAKISATSGHGISEAAYRHDNVVNVNGGITALSSGSAGVGLQGENSSVTVGANGTIDAWHGLELCGDHQSAVNNGTINAVSMGMYSLHADNSLINNGTIKTHASAQQAGDGMVGDGGNTVVNSASGVIDVTGNGLTMQSVGGEKTLVTNLGSVTGDNLGFYGWAGDDKFVNRGTMDGDVSLNGGNDTFDGVGGTLKGSVMGGFGDDMYIIDETSYHLYEKANYGTDTVQSKATWTLGANFEELKLIGTSSINGKATVLTTTSPATPRSTGFPGWPATTILTAARATTS